MKKLGILVMAMVLVCGLSLGVMADELASDSVDVDLIIGSYAEVGFEGGTYELDFPNPDTNNWYGNNQEAVYIPFNVKTNANVNIEVTENMSADLISMLGDDKVWPADGVEDPPSEAVVAPFLALTDGNENFGAVEENSDFNTSDGWILNVDQDAGTSMDYTVFVENKWLSEDGDWWELLADTYNYEVTATVSAQ